MRILFFVIGFAYTIVWFLIGKWYGRHETIAEYLEIKKNNAAVRFKGDV